MNRLSNELLGISPWALPCILLTAIVATFVAPWLSGRLRTPPLVAWLVVASLGGIGSLTMVPHPGLLDRVPGICDLHVFGLPGPAELTTISDRSLNVFLFIPLGVSLSLLPRRSRYLALVLAAFLPAAIEAVQAVMPVLNRSCEAQDVVDNVTGLAIGAVVGLGVVGVAAFAGRIHAGVRRLG